MSLFGGGCEKSARAVPEHPTLSYRLTTPSIGWSKACAILPRHLCPAFHSGIGVGLARREPHFACLIRSLKAPLHNFLQGCVAEKHHFTGNFPAVIAGVADLEFIPYPYTLLIVVRARTRTGS